MKFYVPTSEMKKAVSVVSKALPTASTLEVLECILLDCDDHNLTLTTNSQELGIQTSIPVNMQEAGAICVNGKLLQKIVSSNPDSDLEVASDEETKATIRSKIMKFALGGIPKIQFTLPTMVDDKKSIIVKREALKEAIKKVAFCSKELDANVSLAGITLKAKNNVLRLIATDGHRMAEQKIPYEGKNSFELIVPVRTMVNVAGTIMDEGDMKIAFSDHQILFNFGATTVVGRLLAGRIMGELTLPKAVSTVVVNRMELLSSIQNALLIEKVGEKKPFMLHVTGTDLTMSYQSGIGKWAGKQACQKEGKDVLLGINPKYLMEVLKSLEEENVKLEFTGENKPVLLRNKTYQYLILPIVAGAVKAA